VAAVEGKPEVALAMADGIGLAEKMLGLPGLAVFDVEDVPARW
jgi:hypothetical protein